MTEPLVCPTCASTHPLHERFCPTCKMPLVYAGRTGVDQPVTATHERARKVKKQYLDGDLVAVASASNQAEAELVQGLLLEEGVPSIVKTSGGFLALDGGFAGPRQVFVPLAGAEVAREILGAGALPPQVPAARAGRSTRTTAFVLACVLAVMATGPVAAWVWTYAN